MLGSSFPGLLAAAQGGDEQAFAVLWRDLQPALLRYFRVAAPEAAEDLAADTWVSVIRGLGGSGATGGPSGPGCSPWPATGPSTGAGRPVVDHPGRSPSRNWPSGRHPTTRSRRCSRPSRPGRRWPWWPSCHPTRPHWLLLSGAPIPAVEPTSGGRRHRRAPSPVVAGSGWQLIGRIRYRRVSERGIKAANDTTVTGCRAHPHARWS